MFARLLFAEYVVADLTLANPNVFYGIRHAAKPYTTVPIFAGSDPLPFVPYRLEDVRLTVEEAAKLRAGFEARLRKRSMGPRHTTAPCFS
jgi:hypothetical protein